MVDTSGTSCSMTMKAAPVSSRRPSSSSPRASLSRWAIPAVGSSSSSTDGRWATAQASSSTRRVPVDSSETNRSRNRVRPISSISSSTRSLTASSEVTTAGRPRISASGSCTGADCSREMARASRTVTDGNSRASWNTRPSPWSPAGSATAG